MGSDGYKTYAACVICRMVVHRSRCIIVALSGSQRRYCYACIDKLNEARSRKEAIQLFADALVDNDAR